MAKTIQVTRQTALTMFGLALCFGAFMAADAAENRIYRTTDADGNVVFTDVPPREGEPAEQIVVENPNSFEVEEAIGPRDQWIVESDDTEEVKAFSYRELSIASPQHDETIRNNAGEVAVVAVTNPRLQRGHRMRLMLDGQFAQDGIAAQFNLTNIDRGTHTVLLEIIDEDGTVLKRSDPASFHLMRHHL